MSRYWSTTTTASKGRCAPLWLKTAIKKTNEKSLVFFLFCKFVVMDYFLSSRVQVALCGQWSHSQLHPRFLMMCLIAK